MFIQKFSHQLLSTTAESTRPAIGRRGVFGLEQDGVRFSGGAKETGKPRKAFWRTVAKSIFGGKKAGWLRKAWGLLQAPFVLIYKGLQWMLGFRASFKDWHPLAGKDRKTIFKEIESLNGQLRPLLADRLPSAKDGESLLFNFNWQDIERGGVHKNHLLKTHRSLSGLKDLLAAKDWESTAKGLEKYLSADGKNNSNSCANITFTHAQKLATGGPMKRLALKEAEVSLDDQKENLLMKLPGYEQATGMERLKLEVLGRERLHQQFGLKGPVQEVVDVDQIEKFLQSQKDGTQLMLFDLKGENGHVTLATKLKGQIYHIDNFNHQSAVVSPLQDWGKEKASERLWYGVLKAEAHPALAQIQPGK